MDINAHIFEKKSFNNPSLYEKLIGMMAIDQTGGHASSVWQVASLGRSHGNRVHRDQLPAGNVQPKAVGAGRHDRGAGFVEEFQQEISGCCDFITHPALCIVEAQRAAEQRRMKPQQVGRLVGKGSCFSTVLFQVHFTPAK
jgi:hypothetical protein